MDTLETYPRDELLHTPVDELAPMAEAAMSARERRAVRMFIRRDTYGRYVSVLVYLPRDRYNTGVRERFERILQDQLHGESVEFTVRINESTTARVHFVVHLPKGDEHPRRRHRRPRAPAHRGVPLLARRLHPGRIAEYGEEVGTILGRRYADVLPRGLQGGLLRPHRRGRPRPARGDPHRRTDDGGLDLSLYERLDAGQGEARLKVYRIGDPLSLSEVLPMLSSMGVEVVDERPYELEGLERESMIYEFGLRYGEQLPSGSRELFQDALRAVWDGYNEIDGFNGLVLGAGLTWRQATVLRAYAKYMRQGNSPFAQDYIEDALRGNVDITRLLVALFEARFDPAGVPATAATARRASRSGSWPRSTTWPASTTTGSCAPTSPTSRRRCGPTTSSDGRTGRRAAHLHVVQAGAVGDPGPARSRGRSSRSSSTHRGSRACTCGSARSRAAACAGPTGATTSAPRCSAWSRRRW